MKKSVISIVLLEALLLCSVAFAWTDHEFRVRKDEIGTLFITSMQPEQSYRLNTDRVLQKLSYGLTITAASNGEDMIFTPDVYDNLDEDNPLSKYAGLLKDVLLTVISLAKEESKTIVISGTYWIPFNECVLYLNPMWWNDKEIHERVCKRLNQFRLLVFEKESEI